MPENTTNAYLRTKVLTAPPEQLRMMLLDASVKHARLLLDGIDRDDHEAIYENSTRCRDIVLELLGGIRDEPDPELSERVRALYLFIYRELVDAGLQREVAKARKIIELLEYERETWNQLLDQIARERGDAGGGDKAEATIATAQAPSPAPVPPNATPRNPLPYPGRSDGPRPPMNIQA